MNHIFDLNFVIMWEKMDSRERLQQIAKLAVDFDRKKDYCVAIKYYIQVVDESIMTFKAQIWFSWLFSGCWNNWPGVAE
jgi:hypothetical protein